MAEIVWDRVETLYFGGSSSKASECYRVSLDDTVQKLVSLILPVALISGTLHRETYASSNLAQDALVGVHDPRVVFHIGDTRPDRIWIEGWGNLDESGYRNYRQNRLEADWSIVSTPWLKYIVSREIESPCNG